MTCPRDPPTDGYLLGPRCLGSKWVVMSAGAIPHREAPWLNPSDPIDIDSVTFKAITFHRPPWSPHHLLWADSWLATNYWQEEGSDSSSLCVRGGWQGVRGLLLLLLFLFTHAESDLLTHKIIAESKCGDVPSTMFGWCNKSGLEMPEFECLAFLQRHKQLLFNGGDRAHFITVADS